MKKIILTLLLLLSFNLHYEAQGFNGLQALTIGTVKYDSDAQLYFNQLTGTITPLWKFYVNKYIVRLKADGNWTGLDRLWLFATENQQNATISIKNPTSTAITEVNSITWTSGIGYTGNGTNMYLNTNYIALTGGNYSLNNCALGVYCRTNNDIAKMDMGFGNGVSYTQLDLREGNVSYLDANDNTGMSVANTDSRGLFAVTRSGASATKGWKNGVNTITSTTNPSVSIPNIKTYIFCRNDNNTPFAFSNRNLSLAFIGDNSINQATFYTATQQLMTDLGIQV